jgi:putative transposase
MSFRNSPAQFGRDARGTVMSHSFIQVYIHAVFSTKDRRKIISKEIRPQLWSFMAGICRNKGMKPLAINGMDDHAHVLFNMQPDLSVAQAVGMIKANSSRWMKQHQTGFAWQEGYGAFTVSLEDTAAVARYIRNQEEHHRTVTFEQEFLILLEMNGIKFDPKEVFG